MILLLVIIDHMANTNSYTFWGMEQQQQQQHDDEAIRALDFEEGYHHLRDHLQNYHHHQEEQLKRHQCFQSGLYWRMTGGLALTSGLLFGSCVFCKLVTTRDVLLASLATLLLWTCVTVLCFKAIDLTGPSFLNGCVTPILLLIIYILLWLGYCRCRSPQGQTTVSSKIQNQGANFMVDLEQHLMMVTFLEIVIILSIVLIISQWLSGRSRHLLTAVAACRPYSLLLLFWCLFLLEALLLLLVIFIRRQTYFHHDQHQHYQR